VTEPAQQALAADPASQADTQRLIIALEAANQGLWDWNLRTGDTYLTPTFYRLLGYKPGDFPATFDGWTSLLHPDDVSAVMGGFTALVGEGRDRFELEFRLRNRDGGWRWILAQGMAIERDAEGLPTRVLGINLDITDRRAAESALQESEARFRAIFDNVREAILIHEIDTGAILSVNARASEMFALAEEDLRAASLRDISADVPPYTQADAALWMMRAAAGEPQQFEWQAKDGRGRLFWVEVIMRRARIGEFDRLLTVIRDISVRKARDAELHSSLEHQVQLNRKLEEAHSQLLQSEKMASIGQLAAGVAHELNNPIGFVASNLGSLDGYLKDLFDIIDACGDADPKGTANSLERFSRLKAERDYAFIKTDIGQLMAESRDGLSRVRKIVQDLKGFSRVGEAEWQWANLHTGLDSTLNIVWNELKYKCKVDKEYGDLPEVFCLPSQLNQVFMNLFVNAAQAIETRGEVTIRTGRAGEEVWVEVADTGKGIPRENLNRIFEPFFTTKPVGQGTGLGLSLSYSIVLKHKGRIEVASEVGKGSTFRVVLPIKPELEKPGASPK
jgi:PAS domain S-box-containing protein